MRRAALVAVLLAGCVAAKERNEALARLSARTPKERAAAVHALGRVAAIGDDEAWTAIARAAHDGSPGVRTAVADVAGPTKREDAVDTAGVLLRDPDDGVRIAAARALGARCGDRAAAYLRMGFARSTRAVRPAIAAALAGCGAPLEQTLEKEEASRRADALALLKASSPVQRGGGARQLGVLGRDQDIAVLAGLLDERDGSLVAAAAEALGEAGATSLAPRIAKLLAEPGVVAGAAAEALRSLGPDAIAQSLPALESVAARADDEAEPAALALIEARDPRVCGVAAVAELPAAASLLARAGRCPAHPFVQRLETLLRPGCKPEALSAALESLLAAEGPAPEAAAPLAKMLAAGDPDVRAARAAGHLLAHGAGPALLALIRRERRAIESERASASVRRDSGDSGAAEIAAQAALAPRANREKYDRLMAKLGRHEGLAQAKASAQDQLAALLHGGPVAGQARRERLIAALQAARTLQVKGVAGEAAGLAHDPDRLIAAAARGEDLSPEAAAPRQPPGDPDTGSLRAALWSDDGSERSAACTALRDDAISAAMRLALTHDPERRVRAACSATNETSRPK